MVASADYDMTTLLSQWAEYNYQTFAWVSIDESDNDSNVFLTHVAEALDEVEPIDERASDASASLTSSVSGSVIPRLNSAFWSSERVCQLNVTSFSVVTCVTWTMPLALTAMRVGW